VVPRRNTTLVAPASAALARGVHGGGRGRVALADLVAKVGGLLGHRCTSDVVSMNIK